MAIGFHTGVLQDKTLDIARVHDQVMTDLLTHGLEKQEQREQEFVQMMSTDFINGLNTKAQEVQLEALRKFNDLGTSIYKERGKFGQIKLDDQIKIKKEKDRLQALQDNMRTTLQTFDQARVTLAKDMGRNYDIEESKKNIYKAYEEWNGESIQTIDKMLVPAYGNIGESLRSFIKGYGFGEEEITEITTTQGGQQYLDKVGVRYGGGFKTDEDRIQAMRSWAGEISNQRDALKLFNSEDITEGAKQNMMKVTEDIMRENPDFNQVEALTIAVGMIQDGRGIEGMWTQKRVLDRQKPRTSRTGAGGTRVIPMTSTTLKSPLSMGKYKVGDDIEVLSLGETVKIQVPASSILGGQVPKGMIPVSFSDISYDGYAIGKYTGQIKVKPTTLPGGAYLEKSGSVQTEDAAKAIYSKMPLFAEKVIDVVAGEGDDEGKWIPYLQDDKAEAQTIVVKFDKDYKKDRTYKMLSTKVEGFGERYEKERGGSKTNKTQGKTITAAEFRNMSIPERKAFRESGGQVK